MQYAAALGGGGRARTVGPAGGGDELVAGVEDGKGPRLLDARRLGELKAGAATASGESGVVDECFRLCARCHKAFFGDPGEMPFKPGRLAQTFQTYQQRRINL